MAVCLRQMTVDWAATGGCPYRGGAGCDVKCPSFGQPQGLSLQGRVTYRITPTASSVVLVGAGLAPARHPAMCTLPCGFHRFVAIFVHAKNVGNGKLRREGERIPPLTRMIRLFMHCLLFFLFYSFVPPVFDARQRLQLFAIRSDASPSCRELRSSPPSPPQRSVAGRGGLGGEG